MRRRRSGNRQDQWTAVLAYVSLTAIIVVALIWMLWPEAYCDIFGANACVDIGPWPHF